MAHKAAPQPVGVATYDDEHDAHGSKETQSLDLEEEQSFTSAGLMLKNANADIRRGFVRKVYGILSAQLVLTAFIAAPISQAHESWIKQNSWMMSVSTFMYIVVVCAIACCQKATRSYPANYIILGALTVFMSIIVGFVSATYTWQSVVLCAGLTACVFLALTAYAFTTQSDFTGAGPYLFGGLLVLVMFGFMLSILASFGVALKWGILMYDLAGTALFVFYIIYDTQLIIGGEHKQHEFSVDDYVFAALNLYLDIIQLFLHLLRMLGDNRN